MAPLCNQGRANRKAEEATYRNPQNLAPEAWPPGRTRATIATVRGAKARAEKVRAIRERARCGDLRGAADAARAALTDSSSDPASSAELNLVAAFCEMRQGQHGERGKGAVAPERAARVSEIAPQILEPAANVRRFALPFDAGVVAFDIVGALIKGDFDFLIVAQALQRGLDRRTAK